MTDRPDDARSFTHSSHWGAFRVRVRDGDIARVAAAARSRSVAAAAAICRAALRHPARIDRPVARRGWLERGPGPSRERGDDSFVELSWDEALDRAADELERVVATHGNRAIFGGSYGWASAGHLPPEPEPAAPLPEPDRRLHRAPQQLQHRRVAGATAAPASAAPRPVFRKATSWTVIARHTELLVAFGGLPLKNTFVAPGGMARHGIRAASRRRAPARHADRALLAAARRRGAGGAGALVSARAAERRRGDARRSHTCWSARDCTTRRSSSAAATAPSASSPTCAARATASPRRPSGPSERSGIAADDLRALAREMAAQAHARHRVVLAAARAARRAAGLGGARRSPRCSVRSACPAAASVTATARWATSAAPSATCPADAAGGAQPGARLHSGRAHRRPAARGPARPSSTTARRYTYPDIRLVLLGGRQSVPPPPGPEPAARARSRGPTP